jgi:hypothetical protein
MSQEREQIKACFHSHSKEMQPHSFQGVILSIIVVLCIAANRDKKIDVVNDQCFRAALDESPGIGFGCSLQCEIVQGTVFHCVGFEPPGKRCFAALSRSAQQQHPSFCEQPYDCFCLPSRIESQHVNSLGEGRQNIAILIIFLPRFYQYGSLESNVNTVTLFLHYPRQLK